MNLLLKQYYVLLLVCTLFACKQNRDSQTTIDKATDTISTTPFNHESKPLDLTNCQLVNTIKGLQFTMDSIAKYHLLADNFVEECIYHLDSGNTQSYIIFNNDIDPSYSPHFKLLTLRGQDTIRLTTLCQIYGNDQMDYVISAKGLTDSTFELNTEYTYTYIEGIGTVDSNRVEVERIDIK